MAQSLKVFYLCHFQRSGFGQHVFNGRVGNVTVQVRSSLADWLQSCDCQDTTHLCTVLKIELHTLLYIINRPGVAGAVLHTASSLIN